MKFTKKMNIYRCIMKKFIVLLFLLFSIPAQAYLLYADTFRSYSINDGVIFKKNTNEMIYTLIVKDFSRNYTYKVSVSQNLYNSFISIFDIEAYDTQNKFLYNSKDYKPLVNDDLQNRKILFKNIITREFTKCKNGVTPLTLYCEH